MIEEHDESGHDGEHDRGEPSKSSDGEQRAEQRRSTPLTQQIGRVVVLLLAFLFVAFTIVNRHPVIVDWVFTSSETPLIILLLAAFAIGAIVGAFIAWWRRRGAVVREDGDDPPGPR